MEGHQLISYEEYLLSNRTTTIH